MNIAVESFFNAMGFLEALIARVFSGLAGFFARIGGYSIFPEGRTTLLKMSVVRIKIRLAPHGVRRFSLFSILYPIHFFRLGFSSGGGGGVLLIPSGPAGARQVL